MATSFKIKAVEELRKAKQIEREAEAMAHAQSVAAKYAKNVANEKRIADKMAKIEDPVIAVEEVIEEVTEEVIEEVVVVAEEKPKVKAKLKVKSAQKKRRPAKTKK
tara:strand:+ start:1227 stop:1544 length:318 start_codon:yes stop_codon:yes gene_type:complete